MRKLRRYLPLAIVAAVFAIAIGSGAYLFHRHRPTLRPSIGGRPGAEPPHVRGSADAPVLLEEFGDFECMPCLMLWPALRNLEHDYLGQLAVVFREKPLPQHSHALGAARAAEAAGIQGKFWEMHDMLYTNRSRWVRASDPSEYFRRCATDLGLNINQFVRDLTASQVEQRLAADGERAASLGIDRTPAVFVNGERVQLQGDVEEGLHADIEAALGRGKRDK